MKNTTLTFLGVALCGIAICHAQKINIGVDRTEMDNFVREITDDFNDFRRQSMAQYAEFVKNPWQEFEGLEPIPKPVPQPAPPVIVFDDDKQAENNPIIIDEIIKPIDQDAQPQPIEPIEEVPELEPSYVNFVFFGTSEKVRNLCHISYLNGTSEAAVSSMFQNLAAKDNDNLILDCLNIRKNRNLSDWAYLQMLDKVANKIYYNNPNEAQILIAYLFIQSGYKARIASDGKRLYMLFASKHTIFDKTSYAVDGDFYYGLNKLPEHLRICQASFPKESSLSLLVSANQQFAYEATDSRDLTSKRFPDFKFDVLVNKNLLDFYSTYPSSAINGDIMSVWAMYANAPMDHSVSSTLYPILKNKLNGKSELEAVNILLNLLQTGLKYEYDDIVWGSERTFFAEESLFYPFCDCEDRSILLSRLVRDIIGLKCLLVYYPGHLAVAIEFSDKATKGDYIMLDNHKFIIADPTYINAPVGWTMPGMNNASAKVILLN